MSLIKSFSVEKGDMFYIKHGSSNFTVIDCNLVDDRKNELVDEILSEQMGKDIFRFISTHPDEDHIHGLDYLDDRICIQNFYCVKNKAIKIDKDTPAFKRYCKLRDSSKAFYLEKGCCRCWMNRDDDVKRYGSSGVNILWPVLNNVEFEKALDEATKGGSPNNISPIITYSLDDGVRAMWMGDLESDFMACIEDEVSLGKVDILFAPHHGRSSGKPPKSWMDEMEPKLVVVGEAESDALDYYSGYTHICQNTAGDIVFDCGDGSVHVYTESGRKVKGLDDRGMRDSFGLYYIGSFSTWNRGR